MEAIFLMISARQSYASIGMEICRLEELDFPEEYMSENGFEHKVLAMAEDKAARRIHRFLSETDPLIMSLFRENNILREELARHGAPHSPVLEATHNRMNLVTTLLIYSERYSGRLPILINRLCEIKHEPPVTDYKHTEGYEDVNIQVVYTFYGIMLDIVDEFLETEIRPHL